MSPLTISFVLLAIAGVLITLELLLPSAGVLGILACCSAVTSVCFGFYHSTALGAVLLLGIVVAVPFLFQVAVKIWPHTPLGKMILIGDIDKDDVMPNDSHYQQISDQVGRIGVAKTKMYPSGIVLIDGQSFDAVTGGFPVEAGESVKVVSVQGNRVQVQQADADAAVSTSGSPDPAGTSSLDAPVESLGIDVDFEDIDLGS